MKPRHRPTPGAKRIPRRSPLLRRSFMLPGPIDTEITTIANALKIRRSVVVAFSVDYYSRLHRAAQTKGTIK